MKIHKPKSKNKHILTKDGVNYLLPFILVTTCFALCIAFLSISFFMISPPFDFRSFILSIVSSYILIIGRCKIRNIINYSV